MGASARISFSFAPVSPRCLVPVLALLVLCGCAVPEPRTRVSGRLVELRADLPPPEAKGLADEADAFLGEVAAYLGVEPPSPNVYVFRSKWRLWRFLRTECPAFAERTGATFIGKEGRLIVAVRLKPGGPQRGLWHELTHAVVAARFADPMPWLDEGLAQVFESGCPPKGDADRLQELPADGPECARALARLLDRAKHSDLDRDDYRLARGFAWFLLQDETFGLAAIRRCLEPPAVGETVAERTARCLGTPPEEVAQRFTVFLLAATSAAEQ